VRQETVDDQAPLPHILDVMQKVLELVIREQPVSDAGAFFGQAFECDSNDRSEKAKY
jgi:hypothetical protein